MPRASVCKPIIKYGFEITCYNCGHTFVSVAKSIRIGYVHCGICKATNMVPEGADESES